MYLNTLYLNTMYLNTVFKYNVFKYCNTMPSSGKWRVFSLMYKNNCTLNAYLWLCTIQTATVASPSNSHRGARVRPSCSGEHFAAYMQRPGLKTPSLHIIIQAAAKSCPFSVKFLAEVLKMKFLELILLFFFEKEK